ncbi:MAG: JAB domain-containing protein [Verrucomicrobiota bacterium]|nr:JAB domain-containing protein [Verrucomicrobiota bacterium]
MHAALAAWTKETREHFIALYLNARNNLLASPYVVSVGTLTASLVHPREVFGPALWAGAAGVIVAHNHPSGEAHPSAEDGAATKRLAQAGRTLGVPLLDHVILAGEGYYSFRESGALNG